MATQIVITNYSYKTNLLKHCFLNKKLCNQKFVSFDELKKRLFFDYDNRTLAYIMKKYHIKLDNAKEYVENMYFLKDINQEKVIFLQKLKDELREQNLLYYEDNFKEYLNNKDIIIKGVGILSKEQQLILNGLIYCNDWEFKNYLPKVYEAKSIDEEVEFVAYKISELLQNNVSLQNIKIIADKTYLKFIEKYFDFYNIPINLISDSSFYSTIIAKDFLNNYDYYSIGDNIAMLREKYNNINKLINVINKSCDIEDKKIRKEFIVNDLKKEIIKKEKYDCAVEWVNLDSYFSDDDFVFLLGFNINSYSRIVKDDDYFSDNIKRLLDLDTSIDLNNLYKQLVLTQIKNIKHLIVSYKLSDRLGKYYPSLLIDDLKVNVNKINIDRQIAYSKKYTNILMARDLDNYFKYNEVSQWLFTFLHNLNIPYKEYNNQFKGINNRHLLDYLNNSLTLSYTTLESYNECAFKYYVSKVLKLDIFEENFKTIIGSIMHHILEIGLEKNINVKVEMMNFVKEKGYELNAKELFYLDKISEELEFILTTLIKQQNFSQLNKYLLENELFVYKDKASTNVTFKGLIDKVMYNIIDGKEVLAVVDYKSGNTNITINNIKYGLNMQLPIYLYLLKKSARFKDAVIAGFFIQHVLDGIPNVDEKKSLLEIKENNLKLQGFSSSDKIILKYLDNTYENSKYIKGLKVKENGDFSLNARVLNTKQMEQIIEEVDKQIDLVVDNILQGRFEINPKKLNNKNISCMYCKFKDICFKIPENEIDLGGDNDEVDNRTAASY